MNPQNPADAPAFPNTAALTLGTDKYVIDGLTKREYFAGLALEALVSTLTIGREDHMEYVCRTAVEYADALLRELSRPDPGASGGEGG